MAKHRKQRITATRRLATTTAVAAAASVAVPGVANAAEVVVPNTDYTFQVDGLENVPNINQVPNIEQWVPSLSQQSSVDNTPAPAVQEAPQETKPAAPQPVVPTIESAGQQIVEAARSALGSPYGWGAAGPSAFDCSGLTSWAYAQAGKTIPRTSQGQASAGTPVSLNNLQPGDIIVYYAGASHVGIYAGNGQIIDSLNQGTTVSYRPLDYMPIHSAVRF